MSELTEDSVRAEVRAWLEANWDPTLSLIDWRNRLVDSGWGAPHWPRAWHGRDLPVGLVPAAAALEVRRFAEAGRTDWQMLVLEERGSPPGPASLVALGLTAREAEVLYWIAQGKSNPDIAVILGANVRTVHKHVEHIFQKLGVETRNAAMLAALEILRPAR